MLRILHTGDVHLGRKYSGRNPQTALCYERARLEALENAVRAAEEENCDFLVIAGDLFDTKNVPVSLIRETCETLGGSACPVLVLPGNHDFCEDSGDRLWSRFREYAAENTVLLWENRPFETEKAVFYPCVCHDKHSETNMLGWLKEDPDRPADKVRIGLAHGALEGLSWDREKRYYYMSRRELDSCGMDLWLIGHTHIPYPDGEVIREHRIFNAGTPQQTDISDNAEGTAFVIETDDGKNVTAKRIHTGVLRFVRRSLDLRHGRSLESELEKLAGEYDPASTSLRLTVSGTALAGEYADREEIYRRAGEGFLSFEVMDAELQPEITEEMIDRETMDGSLENRLLKRYIGRPEILNLAYGLVQRCREEKV